MIVDSYEMHASRFGYIFALVACFQLLAAITNSNLVIKFGIPFIFRIANYIAFTGVLACILCLYLTVPPLYCIIFIAVTFSITHGLVLPNSIALSLDPLPETAGFAAAINGMGQTGLGLSLNL